MASSNRPKGFAKGILSTLPFLSLPWSGSLGSLMLKFWLATSFPMKPSAPR
ncbi:hypothetical protein QQ045_003615 [Rhodiola kirilowii]